MLHAGESMQKGIDKNRYQCSRYTDKKRWASMGKLDEVLTDLIRENLSSTPYSSLRFRSLL